MGRARDKHDNILGNILNLRVITTKPLLMSSNPLLIHLLIVVVVVVVAIIIAAEVEASIIVIVVIVVVVAVSKIESMIKDEKVRQGWVRDRQNMNGVRDSDSQREVKRE